jgi:hypothetical protein
VIDYELFAPDDATMQAAITAMNMRVGSGWQGTKSYSVDYYGDKYAQSGTVVVNRYGSNLTIPNLVKQTGRYANVRWMGATVLTLPANITSRGATLTLLQAPYYRVFA